MSQHEQLKKQRVTRRCYTILKYYAEEYGVGTGTSEVFSTVLKALIEESPQLEELLESRQSEDQITERLAHILLPEVRVTVAEQLAVALENCENAITLFELGVVSTQKAITKARLLSQAGSNIKKLDYLHGDPLVSVIFSEQRTADLSFKTKDAASISAILRLANHLCNAGFTEQQKQAVQAAVLRYLFAVQDEYWDSKITKRQILNRTLFAVDRAMRELAQEATSLQKEKARLSRKIGKLDTATLTRAI
jgi:hypothetical protein